MYQISGKVYSSYFFPTSQRLFLNFISADADNDAATAVSASATGTAFKQRRKPICPVLAPAVYQSLVSLSSQLLGASGL